ncbi:hypothetical protein V2J09_003624 [Rumex salicifolius]
MANPISSISLLLFALLSHSAARSPDAKPLLTFKSAADKSNNLSTWTSDTDPCSSSFPWYGVSCFHNRVSKLVLEDLSLTGSFDSLSYLTGLRVLSLTGNRLSGPIPNLSNLTSLKLLFLSRNSISGQIPASLSSISSLYRLDLSFNNLSGEIPANFDRLDRLLTLRLEGNGLIGPISDFRLPNVLDFNVSGNAFDGEIPTSLSSFPSSAFDENPGLCGPPLLPCKPEQTRSTRPGPTKSPIPPAANDSQSPETEKTRRRMSASAIIAVTIGDLAILAVISALLFCFFWRSYAREKSPALESKPSENANNTGEERGRMVFFVGGRRFELEELLRASAEILGKGATGTAYKATLEDGRVVAVKRMKMEAAPGTGEFERRMEVVGRVRHPNVVEVRAYYFAKEEKLVVLDYMANGSLFWLLHGNRGPGRTPLDWTTRLKIAAGAAKGLAYIHSLDLTHANIKSTNVLIDNSGDARISDFAFPTGRSTGYRAPEAGGRLTKKSDVYSFGVLLLELLTGKCPATVEGSGAEVVDLRRWVETVIKEEWTAEVFDVELMRYKDIQDELVGFLHIGLSCTSPAPEQRPTMAQVVSLLDDLRGSHALVSSDGT